MGFRETALRARSVVLGISLFAINPALLWGGTLPVVSVSTSTQHSPHGVSASPHSWRTLPNSAFQAGENLVYVVRWGIITGGRSTLAIQKIEPIAGRPAYHIVSEARSSGIVDTFYKTRDRNETWLDVQSLSTVRYEKHISEGRYRVEQAVDLDQMNNRYRDYSQRLDKGTSNYIEGDIPAYVMDVLGSLYYVRTVPFNVGDSFVLDVYDNKQVWPLVINVKKREKIKVAAGKFDCFRVEPLLRQPGIFISNGKTLEVWMTADQYHMPVLMRSDVAIGHVSAELISYHASPQSISPAP